MATVAAPKTFEFTLTLAGLSEPTIEVGDALYAVIDDALLHSDGPVIILDFDREADTLGQAIDSALAGVKRAGFRVDRVEVKHATGDAS